MSGSSIGAVPDDDYPKRPPYVREEGFEKTWEGQCDCGAVKFEVRGDPLDVKYCHCKSCQRVHAAPMQWAAIFHKKDLVFTNGVKGLWFYNRSTKKQEHEMPCRVLCSHCNAALGDEGRNMFMLMPTLVKFGLHGVPEAWKPRSHIFYSQRVIDIIDGKPKWAGHKDQSGQMPERDE